MKNKLLLVALLISLLFSELSELKAQDFYADGTIQKIEISFSQTNWDYILDTAKQGSDSYTLSKWVKINGVLFDSAGVKYKGNSSYNPNNLKNPFHIELDHFKNQDYMGYKDIKLSNGYNEPSFVREVLLYTIFQKYGEAPRANFAQVYVNGKYMGVYTNVEAVTNTFLNSRFYTNNNTFVFADNGGCDLRYKGSDTLLYNKPYTLKSDYGLTELRNFCDTLNRKTANIEKVLDVDRTLWHLAFLNAFVTLDSYIGNSKHNYYLYRDHNNRFIPIIWDLNGGLGIFNKPADLTTLTVAEMQSLTPLLHANDSLWPLVKNVLANPMFQRMYIAHFKTLLNENIVNTNYTSQALFYQSLIDTAVKSDPNKFGTYAQFLSNLHTNVVLGPKTVPGITFLMEARNTFLNSTPEFQKVPPQILNTYISHGLPPINSNVVITAKVSNATNVYLGIRNSLLEKFTRLLMYDDGLHGDGLANDGTYGVTVFITSTGIQYYVYAENNNAGVFLPPRAEHEYFRLDSEYPVIKKGDLVINELMAINSNTVQNAKGNYSDWIELYNTTSTTLGLDFLNLSDDNLNPSKWQFPKGTTISAKQYMIVWADADTSPTELHCNFKLSGTGEKLILSYPNGTIIDQIDFSQQNEGISYGRFPNATGPFVYMNPTFKAENTKSLGVLSSLSLRNFYVYPNPSKGQSIIRFPYAGAELTIFDVSGKIVFEKSNNSITEVLDLKLDDGIYFVQCTYEAKKEIIKLIIQN